MPRADECLPPCHEAQRELLACMPQLRRYARGLLYDADLTEDLVQDTLERAWLKLPQWQAQRGGLRAWAFSIMHNLFVDQLRSRHAQLAGVLAVAPGSGLPEEQEAPSQADGLVLRDLDRALQRLAPEQRDVILLVAVEGLTYEQTAVALGVPVGTVMSRLSRARARLRADLQEPAQQPGAPHSSRSAASAASPAHRRRQHRAG